MTGDARPPESPGGLPAALRAVIFIGLLYGLMAVMGLCCLVPSLLSRRWAMYSIHRYCAAALWMLRVIVGTRVEFRGAVPAGPCIIASKHQSFLDVLGLVHVLSRPAFVMKKSLRWAPILGAYAARLGSIPIDRGAGGEATRAMLVGARSQAAGRQIIIFPQGTRVHPAADTPYRKGVIRLYEQTGYPLVLVALNTGWYWPRTGIRRTPGTVVIEFLETIPPGRPAAGLLGEVAGKIEAASARLAKEAAAELRTRGVIA